jgi:pterin-4a-carbinolamine dehydratase
MSTKEVQNLETMIRERPKWKIVQMGAFSIQKVRSFDEFKANVDFSTLKPAILT